MEKQVSISFLDLLIRKLINKSRKLEIEMNLELFISSQIESLLQISFQCIGNIDHLLRWKSQFYFYNKKINVYSLEKLEINK